MLALNLAYIAPEDLALAFTAGAKPQRSHKSGAAPTHNRLAGLHAAKGKDAQTRAKREAKAHGLRAVFTLTLRQLIELHAAHHSLLLA